MGAEYKVINWIDDKQPNFEDIQVAPQAFVPKRVEEQGIMGLDVEQEAQKTIQEETTKGKSEDALEVPKEREKMDMS